MMKNVSQLLGELAICLKTKEFLRARIKLTLIHTIIISIILVIFSVAIIFQTKQNIISLYSWLSAITIEEAKVLVQKKYPKDIISDFEVEEENGILEYSFILNKNREININPYTKKIFQEEDDEDIWREFLDEFLENILFINLIILFWSSILWYILAWYTLRPIEKKVAEQNRFIEDASHEFRNPLTAIKLTSEELLKNSNLDSDDTSDIQSIAEESNRLITLSEDLFYISKNISQKSTKDSINLKDTIIKTTNSLSHLASKKDITIDTTIVDYTIAFNQSDIEKILFNLLHNAIKFSHTGWNIELHLDKKWVFTIKDFWIWITETNHKEIFKRFYKADESRNFVDGWSGLWLSIVKEILDKNNVNISVKSKLWEWTRFKLYF